MRRLEKLSVVAVVVAARVAWPCSGATCDQFFGLVPRPGSTIPANAAALGVQLAQFSESAWDGGTTATQVLDTDPQLRASAPSRTESRSCQHRLAASVDQTPDRSPLTEFL